ncbi:MAG: CRISPR-associated endonuclease Cas2 [Nitrospirae bacterium]|nr:CRISPR-associated endonuclease Cas2 [Nitrospirota bacterium]
MFVMVSYDIKDDGIRRKIQKIIEGFGERVQYSVFECRISESQYRELKKKVISVMDKDSDSIRFYKICNFCSRRVEYQGNGKIAEEDFFFMV